MSMLIMDEKKGMWSLKYLIIRDNKRTTTHKMFMGSKRVNAIYTNCCNSFK